MKRSKPELLAPAGDLERLKIAILYGADAVYVGGPSLGLRANAINFTFEELKEGCEFAHSHDARVHVAVNIALHNKEIELVKAAKNTNTKNAAPTKFPIGILSNTIGNVLNINPAPPVARPSSPLKIYTAGTIIIPDNTATKVSKISI